MTLPAIGNLRAETLTYGYDYLGAPLSMQGTSFYVTNTDYGQDNSVEQLQFGPNTAAVWQTLTHDVPTDRLTSSGVSTLTSTGNVDTEQYGYDLSGNVTSETDTVPGQTVDRQCFDYDYLQRLTDAWTTASATCGAAGSLLGGPAPYWQTYTYDLLGNRTKAVQHATAAGGTDTTTTYSYAVDGHPQAVSAFTTTSPVGTTTVAYGYSANGDTTSRPGPDGGTQTLTWDQNDRLTRVAEGSSAASYVYDAAGNRLITRDSTGATLFLPSGELHVSTLGVATGTRYYSYAGQTVAQRIGTTLTYLTGDQHGTADLEINPTTLLATKHRLDPFGNPRDTSQFPGDRGFIGGEKDATAGLTHLGARDYDPTLGRFVSVDPLVDTTHPATLNPYVYSNDNPETLSDPTGQFSITDGVHDYPLPPRKPSAQHGGKPHGGSGKTSPAIARPRCGGLYPCGSPYAPPCSAASDRDYSNCIALYTLLHPTNFAHSNKTKHPSSQRAGKPNGHQGDAPEAPHGWESFGQTCVSSEFGYGALGGIETCTRDDTGEATTYLVLGGVAGAGGHYGLSQETVIVPPNGSDSGFQVFLSVSGQFPVGPEVGGSASISSGGAFAVAGESGVGVGEMPVTGGFRIPIRHESGSIIAPGERPGVPGYEPPDRGPV